MTFKILIVLWLIKGEHKLLKLAVIKIHLQQLRQKMTCGWLQFLVDYDECCFHKNMYLKICEICFQSWSIFKFGHNYLIYLNLYFYSIRYTLYILHF